MLAEWWPLLLPGISGGSTHPVIRVGHAVRVLLGGAPTVPRRAELGHALGYWAARHRPLHIPRTVSAPGGAAEALDAVTAVVPQDGGLSARLPRIGELPAWPRTAPEDPDAARGRLIELVRAATHRYATHAHGSPVMLVHAATAPNAVLRTLPALPRELWGPGLAAAWSAAAAVTASYTPDRAVPPATTGTADPGEVFARAAEHGDAHAVKLADTALDVGGQRALAAALRGLELLDPAG